MSDEKPGFKIQGEFYPWIGFDEWLIPDCRLVRKVTGYNETELLRGKASNLLVNVGFAAVAFHRQTGASVEDVADFFDRLPPEQVEAVGFRQEKEADAGPPDETPPGSEPSESGEPSSEEPQAT